MYTLPFIVIATLLVSYIGFNQGYAVDDSYITFRYAQNALEGHGLVFNVGQRYYGSTAMGYAALLAVIVKAVSVLGVTLQIHRVSTALSALSIACVASVCARVLLDSARSPLTGALAATIASVVIFVLPLSSEVAAHETYAYVALLSAASYLAIFGHSLSSSAMLLLLATTIRPDSLLFAAILFCVLGLASSFGPAGAAPPPRALLKSGALYVSGVAGWVAAMRLYCGTFFPGTMTAKKAQVLLGCFPLFNLTNVAAALDRMFAGKAWIVLSGFAALAVLGTHGLSGVAALERVRPSRLAGFSAPYGSRTRWGCSPRTRCSV